MTPKDAIRLHVDIRGTETIPSYWMLMGVDGDTAHLRQTGTGDWRKVPVDALRLSIYVGDAVAPKRYKLDEVSAAWGWSQQCGGYKGAIFADGTRTGE